MQKKLVRFEKIAKEAAEQSHRSSVPTIFSPLNRQSLVTDLHTYDLCLVCDEDEAKLGRKGVLKEQLEKVAPGMRVLIIVGPEGGMARQEVDQLTEAGAIPCSLGPRILRTETASYIC